MLNNLIFDRNLLLIRRNKTANSLAKADFLIKRSFENIIERLSEMNRSFTSVLNLGSRFGSDKILGNVIEADFSANILSLSTYQNKILIDEENLNLEPNQFDLIISVLNLHLVNDLPGCLIKIREALKPKGILIASVFGGENLPELRSTLIKTEMELFGGASPRMMPSIEIKQLGSLLQRTGFHFPIVDSDVVEVHYKQPIDLLHDLQNMGETNIMISRNKNYLGKKFWKNFTKNYIEDFSINESEIVAHFEILTMTSSRD